MTPQEESKIRAWNREQTDDVQLRIMIRDDEQSRELLHFCDDLSRYAPKINIIREQNDSLDNRPCIIIHPRLNYYAVPLDTELEPFLNALNSPGTIPPHLHEQLDKIQIPVFLKLYIARHCPFCPLSVKLLLPLAASSDLVHLNIIDAGLFTEMAAEDNIQSVPALLMDEQFRWTGSMKLEEILDVLTNRDPSNLSSESMERMLKEGNADKLAGMMLENEAVFKAFPDLIAHEKWPVRLGAMVAAETIAEQNISLAASMTEELWNLFHDSGDSVKGDILYILGISGNNAVLPGLKEIVSSGAYNAEIQEAAQEAIDNITGKG